jgi:hypothetical protein
MSIGAEAQFADRIGVPLQPMKKPARVDFPKPNDPVSSGTGEDKLVGGESEGIYPIRMA